MVFHRGLCLGRFFSYCIQWTPAQSLQLIVYCITLMKRIYFFCHPSNCASLKKRVLSCIHAINNGFLCDAPHHVDHISMESFTLADGEVKPVDSVSDLGTFFDSDMNTRLHVDRLVSSCYYQMRRIRYIKRWIPTSKVITLMNSFINARVDYCNSLLAGLPVYQTDRIQTVLDDAARLVFGGSRRDDMTPVLRDRLHWLRAPQRIQFKVTLLVYKAINNLAPDYITSYC